MANEEQLAILKQGVDLWNRWRKEHPEVKPDLEAVDLAEANLMRAVLKEANLTDAYLMRADLMGADLTDAYLKRADFMDAHLNLARIVGADLTGADLTGADLTGADFTGADLTGAQLKGADFTRAHLERAYLKGADLTRADLTGADLKEAHLANSFMAGTILADLDLRSVVGLESIHHHGPSHIGIDTVFKSKGKIPEAFLRGCGIPDSFITYMASLTAEALQYYSCFISYSTKDQAFAKRLHADLQANGVRCWFAPEDIKAGQKLQEQFPAAIRIYDKLLVVLSKNSMESEWVKTEIYHARQNEIRNKKRKLFPIGLVAFHEIREWEAFDADVGKDMAREIREYFIPDFSNWEEHDAYKKAFDRLLRDLKQQTE